MEQPSPSTAPDAIRTIAAFLRESVRESRASRWQSLRTETVARLRDIYEQAPVDESILAFPVVRVGNALANGPGGTYVAPHPDMQLHEGYGYDRIVIRPRQRARLTKRECEPLPDTWSVLFYEQLSWPVEKVQEGAHPFRLFLEISRGAWTVSIPIHDSLDPWTEPSFKAKAPGGFPVPLNFPFRGYITVDDRTPLQTYCRWLTLYLAQRMYVTDEEEQCALGTFFSATTADLTQARYVAYDRMKRRFVQPVGGRVSFPSYFWRASDAALRESRWQEPVALFDPASPFVDLTVLRLKEPSLHRAVLHRLSRGTVTVVEVAGRECLRHDDVDRIDQERLANAQVRSKSPYSTSQRSDWLRRLQSSGMTKATARRKLARWINARGLSADEIERSISDSGPGSGAR